MKPDNQLLQSPLRKYKNVLEIVNKGGQACILKTVTALRAFRCTSVAVWNVLPSDIKKPLDLCTFKSRSNTFLYN